MLASNYVKHGGIVETMKVVDYDPSYAREVAEMWNRSSSGWMGRDFNSSEEKVLEDEAKDSYHNLYLAVSNEQVLGYAKLSKYAEEKDVAYIDLLSVDPMYHGKGIGRMLVQKCVLRAAELGYQRLDLFTWAGNTKAVPLYKKCGFFWEKMESQATHLMNFLPSLLNNPLIKPYFNFFHWYDDNARMLETQPDGRLQDGFQLYDYKWEKEGKTLEISFERSGRGIVAIKTPDFAITTCIDHAKPVFGANYQISYHIQNFASKPMDIKLQGSDDGIIAYNCSHHQVLGAEAGFVGSYMINPLSQELTEWETCPGVRTTLSIEGKEIELKTGLLVQYPLSVSLRVANSIIFPNRQETMYLNMENHFKVACSYHIYFPEDDKVHLLNRHFDVCLNAGERAHLELEFIANGACLFNPKLHITAMPDDGSELEFTVDSRAQIFAANGMDGKETPELIQLINGYCYLYYSKTGSKNWGGYGSIYGNSFRFSPPQIGMPYSEEFDNELPFETSIEQLGSVMQLSLKFRSRDNDDLEFGYIYKLYPTGMMEAYIKIYKLPETGKSYHAMLKLMMNEQKLCYECNGKLVQAENDVPGASLSDFARSSLTGNWLFSQSDDSYQALIWNPEFPATIGKYWLCWELDLHKVNQLENKELLFARMFLDVFRNPYQVRNAALGFRKATEPILPVLELKVNNGNPILGASYPVEFWDKRDAKLKGSFSLLTGSIEQPNIVLVDDDNAHAAHWQVQDKGDSPMELICCQAELSNYNVSRSMLCLRSKGKVTTSESEGKLYIDNGKISIATPLQTAAPALCSLQYEGCEFLDSGYPDFAAKSFFNPFLGGIYTVPGQLNKAALLAESHYSESISLHDQYGNLWQGLAITTEIKEFEPLKGIKYRQCYVMHPNVPVLVLLCEIIQNNGWREFVHFKNILWLRHDDNQNDAELTISRNGDKKLIIKAGAEQISDGEYLKHIAYKHKECDAYLQVCHLNKHQHHYYADGTVLNINFTSYSQILEPGRQWLQAQFLILSPELYEPDSLMAITNLRFS